MTAPPSRDPRRLFTTEQVAIETHGIADLLRQHYGLRAAKLEPLTGERDRNLHVVTDGGETLVVKLSNPGEDPAVIDFQTRALLHLARVDPTLPVPQLRRTHDGGSSVPIAGGSVMRVFGYLEGLPMHRLASARPACAALGATLARLDRALEAYTHPAAGHALLWDLMHASCIADLLPEVAEPGLRDLAGAAIRAFSNEVMPSTASLPWQAIHNDLNPYNVLVDGGAPAQIRGVLDFGDLVRAPRIQDVAVAASYLVEAEGDALAGVVEFLDGYEAVLPLADNERAMLADMIAARMAMTVVITEWRARHYPENAPYILRNHARSATGLRRLAELGREGASARLRRSLCERAA